MTLLTTVSVVLVIRQRLLVLCVMWVMVGARGLSVPPETEAVGAAAPCGVGPPCGAVGFIEYS